MTIKIQPGDRFGQWTVVAEVPGMRHGRSLKRRVKVRCTCGRVVVSQLNNLRSGKSSRCRSCAGAMNGARNRNTRRVEHSVNELQAFRAYARGAKRRGLPFEITLEQFRVWTKSKCRYCGQDPANVYELKRADGSGRAGEAFVYSGLDRVDPAQGYVSGNIVPCCRPCNQAKGAMTVFEFKSWLGRAAKHLGVL